MIMIALDFLHYISCSDVIPLYLIIPKNPSWCHYLSLYNTLLHTSSYNSLWYFYHTSVSSWYTFCLGPKILSYQWFFSRVYPSCLFLLFFILIIVDGIWIAYPTSPHHLPLTNNMPYFYPLPLFIYLFL